MALIQLARQNELDVITLDELKQHLNITHNDEDDRLTNILVAAFDYVERNVSGGRTIVETQYQLLLDWWGNSCRKYLPLPPFASMEDDGITYYDDNNDLQTLDTNDYVVVAPSFGPAFIELYDVFPSTFNRPDAISITWTAGGNMTPTLRAAVLLVAGALNERREATSEQAIKEIELGVESLTSLNGYGFFPGVC